MNTKRNSQLRNTEYKNKWEFLKWKNTISEIKYSIAEFNRSGISQKWSEILNIKWLKIKHRKGKVLKKKKKRRVSVTNENKKII